jgi:hypothetical protein
MHDRSPDDFIPEHSYMIVLEAESQEVLIQHSKFLEENGIAHAGFHEADYQDELTAISSFCEPKWFRNFPLLK